MLRSRWLSPRTGRFLTKDIWFNSDYSRPSSINSWIYSFSNPVNYTDPSGYSPWLCDNGPCPGLNGSINYREYNRSQTRYNEIVKPLRDWSEAGSFRELDIAVGARLLLSEMGTNLVFNKKWQIEGSGILWVIQNRVDWNRRIRNAEPGYASIFDYCDTFFGCATASGQFATTTSSRGLDPLFQDPDEPKCRENYYEDYETQTLSVQRASQLSTGFAVRRYPDPTCDSKGCAVYFSHYDDGPSGKGIIFERQVDFYAGLYQPYRRTTVKVPFEQARMP
jgi:hypothetical protein